MSFQVISRYWRGTLSGSQAMEAGFVLGVYSLGLMWSGLSPCPIVLDACSTVLGGGPGELSWSLTLLVNLPAHLRAAFAVADHVWPQTQHTWTNLGQGQGRGDPKQHRKPCSVLQLQEGEKNASVPSSALMDFSTIFYKRSFLFM